jgi:hypothetical protein
MTYWAILGNPRQFIERSIFSINFFIKSYGAKACTASLSML